MARKIRTPRNLKPNEIVPFTPNEIQKIIAACDAFGKTPYERLRARAIILTLRYTVLRIGDVAMLDRIRISRDGTRERIFLRTEKSGKPVFLPVPREMTDASPSFQCPGERPPTARTTSGAGRVRRSTSSRWWTAPCDLSS